MATDDLPASMKPPRDLLVKARARELYPSALIGVLAGPQASGGAKKAAQLALDQAQAAAEVHVDAFGS